MLLVTRKELYFDKKWGNIQIITTIGDKNVTIVKITIVVTALVVKVGLLRQRIFKHLPMDNNTTTQDSSSTMVTITIISTKPKIGKLLVMEPAVLVPVASTKASKITLRAKEMVKLKHYIPPPSRRRLLLHQLPMGDIYHTEKVTTIL